MSPSSPNSDTVVAALAVKSERLVRTTIRSTSRFKALRAFAVGSRQDEVLTRPSASLRLAGRNPVVLVPRSLRSGANRGALVAPKSAHRERPRASRPDEFAPLSRCRLWSTDASASPHVRSLATSFRDCASCQIALTSVSRLRDARTTGSRSRRFAHSLDKPPPSYRRAVVPPALPVLRLTIVLARDYEVSVSSNG